MDEYCSSHPGVKIVRPMTHGMFSVGNYCPKCREEAVEKRRHDDLISEQRQMRELVEQQEEQRAREARNARERELLTTGLLEFDTEFQSEWETVAKYYTKMSKFRNRSLELLDQLRTMFLFKLSAGSIPEEILAKANKKFNTDTYQEALQKAHKRILLYTDQIQGENPAYDAQSLYSASRVYANNGLHKPKPLPPSGKHALVSAMILLLFGVTCNSLCNSSLNPVDRSFASVVFIWPSILLTMIFLAKLNTRKKVEKRNSDYQSALIEFTSIYEDAVFGRDSSVRGNLFSLGADRISHFLEENYLNWAFNHGEHSKEGRELNTHICQEGGFSTVEDMEKAYDESRSQYEYMRNTIQEVGQEVLDGHRVSARLKTRKIELLRCPSCGGPLANDGKEKCYYCGSRFRMN